MANANCIFCGIIAENDKSKIMYEDDKVVVFPDIKPAAELHLLVVPKEHIVNAKCLLPEQNDLVKHMVCTGEKLVEDRNLVVKNARMGFHWPPFCSIPHLHLHVICPTSDMNFISRMIFKENSWWFVGPEYVLHRHDK